MALLQHDFKRLLAFHSVSQIGYIITALGMAIIENSEVGAMVLIGGIYHMINHAVFKGLLFLVAGAVLYITGTTDLDSVSGLGKKMPFTMAMFLFGAAAISGIPPFNGFASKWIIYEAGFNGGLGIASIIAIVVSALTLASFIKVGHSIFFGPQKNKYKNIQDVPVTMKISMGILSILTLILGLIPKIVVENLLMPVIRAIYNLRLYIGSALGNIDEIFEFGEIRFKTTGIYNPTNFLILFIVLLLGVLLFLIFKSDKAGEEINEKSDTSFDMSIFKKYKHKYQNGINYSNVSIDSSCKYEVFIGGEDGDSIKVGSNDLFWGMKYQLKEYFNGIKDAHTGNVNDYALWIVATLLIVTIVLFLFI